MQTTTISNLRSLACSYAAIIYKNTKNKSEALAKGWKLAKLIFAMTKGEVQFSYFKKSTGEERLAVGTIEVPFNEVKSRSTVLYKDSTCDNQYRSFKPHLLAA